MRSYKVIIYSVEQTLQSSVSILRYVLLYKLSSRLVSKCSAKPVLSMHRNSSLYLITVTPLASRSSTHYNLMDDVHFIGWLFRRGIGLLSSAHPRSCTQGSNPAPLDHKAETKMVLIPNFNQSTIVCAHHSLSLVSKIDK